MATYGSVPSSAFVRGHINLLVPVANYFNLSLNINRGMFLIQGSPYYWILEENGSFTVTAKPDKDLEYVDLGEVPSRLIDLIREGKLDNESPKVERAIRQFRESIKTMDGLDSVEFPSYQRAIVTIGGKKFTVAITEIKDKP